jgi:hypothetical protein
MSADKYSFELVQNEEEKKKSIFALKMVNNKGGISSGEIYYFNKNEDKSKKIENLSNFNLEEKKIHIIVYNGRELAYYKPSPDNNNIDNPKLINKLNTEYAMCIIINIIVRDNKNTYIFLRDEKTQTTKHDKDGILKKMNPDTEETFKKYNLINIVRALFILIEDYRINIEDVKKEEPVPQNAEEAARLAEEEEEGEEEEDGEFDQILKSLQMENRQDKVGGAGRVGGKRKYKANVNQKSLKKMSTIIKKLLKINLNIKPAAKPKAKPVAKPTDKPKAKPAAKPAAKPTDKPKAKPTDKPKAKPTAKPKAKPTAKPKAKPTAKPKAKPTAKPKAKPTAKPKAKPTAKPKAKPTAKPKAKK